MEAFSPADARSASAAACCLSLELDYTVALTELAVPRGLPNDSRRNLQVIARRQSRWEDQFKIERGRSLSECLASRQTSPTYAPPAALRGYAERWTERLPHHQRAVSRVESLLIWARGDQPDRGIRHYCGPRPSAPWRPLPNNGLSDLPPRPGNGALLPRYRQKGPFQSMCMPGEVLRGIARPGDTPVAEALRR